MDSSTIAYVARWTTHIGGHSALVLKIPRRLDSSSMTKMMVPRVLHWTASLLDRDEAFDIGSLLGLGRASDGEKTKRAALSGVRLMHRMKNIPYVVSRIVVSRIGVGMSVVSKA